jgi:hypothetical protein
LKTRASIDEGGQRAALEDLGLEFERQTEAIDELERQIAIVEWASNGRQIVNDALEFAGVGYDRHVAAGSGAEGFAEVEVGGGLVVEEELVEAVPGGAGDAVGALDEAVELIGESSHEPQRDVDVHGMPIVVRFPGSSALGDMIHGFYAARRNRKICRHLEKFAPVESTLNLICVAISTLRIAGLE